jgi:hypothetical protein
MTPRKTLKKMERLCDVQTGLITYIYYEMKDISTTPFHIQLSYILNALSFFRN